MLSILFESTGHEEDSFTFYFEEMSLHAFNFYNDRIKSLNLKYEFRLVPVLGEPPFYVKVTKLIQKNFTYA